MKIKFLWVLLASVGINLFCTTIHAAPANNSMPLDQVVAVVNENVITESQLRQQMNGAKQQLQMSHTPIPNPAALRRQLLNQLINTELQLQVAKSTGVTTSEADIDKAISDIAARNNIPAAKMRQELQKQGINMTQYRKDIGDQVTISQIQQRAVAGKINISEQEVNQLAATLAKRPTKNAQPADYRIQDILISLPATPSTEQVQQANTRAKKLLAKLHQGANFQLLAAEDSNGQQALQGGDLGWRKLSELPELFAQQVKTMKPGDITGPIRAPNGLHLLHLAAVRNQENLSHSITETQAKHILIKSDALSSAAAIKLRLESLRNDIVHGVSFDKIAKENSQDVNSALQGGAIGWVKPGMLDPKFEEVMNKLKPGEISQPFASSFGWHLVQVTARRKIDDTKNSVHEQARQIIFKRKAEAALQSWLDELRSQAYIKITNDNG